LKALLTGLALLLLVNLTGIVCLPGSGTQVEGPDRSFHFAYHSSSDDLHFYGSNFWAVRFDFANYYFPTLLDLSFTVSALRLWVPQTGDSVKVRLMTDVEGQPGLPQLADLRTVVTSNQITLPLPAPITTQQIWMLVEYNTNFSSRFVSASQGGGSRSFFLNTSMDTPYYQSLASAGFPAELLFGAEGEFVDVSDLRLKHLGLDGDISPGTTVYPNFSLHNHSGQHLSSVTLNLSLLTPDAESNFNRTIHITDLIPAYADYVWDSGNPAYFDQAIDLPAQPMQMRLRGTLSSELGQTDYSGNNTLDRYLYSFADTPPLNLVENFFRTSNAPALLSVEAQVLEDALYRPIHPLSYFPILADSLSAPGAMLRFNWYGFNSTPVVVLGGKRSILGYDGGFGPEFTANCDSLITDKSFISSGSATLTYAPDSVGMRFSFSNENTALLSGTGIYDLAANTLLFSGLFRHEDLDGSSAWVFDRWITHALPITESLNQGETMQIEADMARTGLDYDYQYRVYYWLQEQGAGPVYYAGMQDLNFPVNSDEELLAKPVLSLMPNPLRGQSSLTLSLGRTDSKSDYHLSIYNLRGQLIHKLTFHEDRINLPSGIFPASGIYFVRVATRGSSGPALNGKIIVIK